MATGKACDTVTMRMTGCRGYAQCHLHRSRGRRAADAGLPGAIHAVHRLQASHSADLPAQGAPLHAVLILAPYGNALSDHVLGMGSRLQRGPLVISTLSQASVEASSAPGRLMLS